MDDFMLLCRMLSFSVSGGRFGNPLLHDNGGMEDPILPASLPPAEAFIGDERKTGQLLLLRLPRLVRGCSGWEVRIPSLPTPEEFRALECEAGTMIRDPDLENSGR